MKISQWIYIVLVALAFIGMTDSSYVALHHSQGFLIPCGFAGGCDQVLNSPYAQFLGIPIAWFGLLFYLTVAAAGLYAFFGYPKLLRISLVAATGAFPITLYLLYLQAFVIKPYCDYCLLSAALVILIFVLHLWARPWQSV